MSDGPTAKAMEALLQDGGEILSIAENAFGKRTAVDQYRLQTRGGMGIINLKVSDKTGEVISAKQVRPDDGMMLITQEGKIIRIAVAGVRVIGRSTQGVKLMDLDGEDQLVAVAAIADREDEAEEPAPDEPVN